MKIKNLLLCPITICSDYQLELYIRGSYSFDDSRIFKDYSCCAHNVQKRRTSMMLQSVNNTSLAYIDYNASTANDDSMFFTETYKQILVHILFVEAVVIFIPNAVCLFVIFKHRKLLKKLQNIYLSGLLISHVGNNVTFILGYGTKRISWKVHHTIINIRYLFYASACVYTLLLSLDRYLAIRRPFYYQTISKYFILNTNIMAICLTFAFILTYSINELYGIIGSFIVVMLVSGLLAAFNSVMYVELKKQLRTIEMTTVHDSTEKQIDSK